jgi:hypothetical protein
LIKVVPNGLLVTEKTKRKRQTNTGLTTPPDFDG